MTNLFRSEALNRENRLEGTVIIGAPFGWKVFAWTTFVLIAALVSLAFTTEYTDRKTAPGWIVPDGGLIRISSKDGGVINQIYAGQGTVVEKGAPLVQVKMSKSTSEGDAGTLVEDATLEQIEASWSGLNAQADTVRNEEKALRTRRDGLIRQLSEMEQAQAYIIESRDITEERLKRIRSLNDLGFTSTKATEDANSDFLSALERLSQSRQNINDAKSQIDEVQSQLSQIPDKLSRIRAENRASVSALNVSLTNQRANHLYTLNAPVAGRVGAITIYEGQSVQANTVTMVIVPNSSSVTAELFVPSSAIGFIQLHDEVKLRYQAYPYQKFGTGKGVVLSISEAILAPQELNVPGLSVTEPVYKVIVQLDQAFVFAYGKRFPLQSGMVVDADIVVDKRSLVEWLFEPLYSAGRR